MASTRNSNRRSTAPSALGVNETVDEFGVATLAYADSSYRSPSLVQALAGAVLMLPVSPSQRVTEPRSRASSRSAIVRRSRCMNLPCRFAGAAKTNAARRFPPARSPGIRCRQHMRQRALTDAAIPPPGQRPHVRADAPSARCNMLLESSGDSTPATALHKHQAGKCLYRGNAATLVREAIQQQQGQRGKCQLHTDAVQDQRQHRPRQLAAQEVSSASNRCNAQADSITA
jgi:hypothetical protein